MNQTKKEPAWLGIDSLYGKYMFGMTDTPTTGHVEPAMMATITCMTHVYFKPERLFVHRACASDFLIRHIFAGTKRGLTINADPLITEPFAVNFDDLPKLDLSAFDGKLIKVVVDKTVLQLLGAPCVLPTLSPGLSLSLQIENIGSKPSRFLGALLGEALW